MPGRLTHAASIASSASVFFTITEEVVGAIDDLAWDSLFE
jgi:hypothetical protein